MEEERDQLVDHRAQLLVLCLDRRRWATIKELYTAIAVPGLTSPEAAVIFVLVTSFDQATVSLVLGGPGVVPLPVRILNLIEVGVDPAVAAVSTLLILFAFALVALLQRLLGLDRAFDA